jgi:hypothetical protein
MNPGPNPQLARGSHAFCLVRGAFHFRHAPVIIFATRPSSTRKGGAVQWWVFQCRLFVVSRCVCSRTEVGWGFFRCHCGFQPRFSTEGSGAVVGLFDAAKAGRRLRVLRPTGPGQPGLFVVAIMSAVISEHD